LPYQKRQAPFQIRRTPVIPQASPTDRRKATSTRNRLVGVAIMATKGSDTPLRSPRYDRAVLKDLARCYARAAVDRLIDEAQPEPKTKKAPPARGRKGAPQ
jgi:hypothetical protein